MARRRGTSRRGVRIAGRPPALDRRRRDRPVSALGIAWFALIAVAAGVILWLALSAEGTVDRLRAASEIEAPSASAILPEVASVPPPPEPIAEPAMDAGTGAPVEASTDEEPSPGAAPAPPPPRTVTGIIMPIAPPAPEPEPPASLTASLDRPPMPPMPARAPEPSPASLPPPDVVVDAVPAPEDGIPPAPSSPDVTTAAGVPPEPASPPQPEPEIAAAGNEVASGTVVDPDWIPPDMGAQPPPEPPTDTAAATPSPAPAPEPESVAIPAPALDLLTEPGPSGPLPRIAPDGTQPWQAFAAPHADAGRPQIALVVVDLGLMAATTRRALDLPAPVTLAFSPYAPQAETWLTRAREAGHEVLMQVPTEPEGFPEEDPGPQTLQVSLGPDQNLERLHWVMGRGVGYVGLADLTGSRFAASADSLRPVMAELARRGLLWLDGRHADDPTAMRLASQAGVPHLSVDAVVGDIASPDAIDTRLAELETIARRNGRAVGLVVPYPVAFDRLEAWAQTLDEQGLSLAPVSALARAGS